MQLSNRDRGYLWDIEDACKDIIFLWRTQIIMSFQMIK